MNVFIGYCILAGCALIAGSVYRVGRQIARVLWGILCVIEKDELQRRVLEEQKTAIFAPRNPITDPSRLDMFSNAIARLCKMDRPWDVPR